MNIIQYGGILLMALVGSGCAQEHDHQGRTPLVEVAGEFLYREDLQAAAPVHASKDDSLLFAEHYIRNWVEETLLFKQAEGNIPDNAKIARWVENYRRALIMHTYQEELINQKLAGDITDLDIQTYYDQHPDVFRAEEPFVRGLFIKVPLKGQGLDQVRQWYKRNQQSAIENLEKYSLRHAVDYRYFYDRWLPLDDVAALIPLTEAMKKDDYLAQHPNLEVKDTAFVYFLHVEEFLGKGKARPLDFARDEIKEILINLKRVEFMNQVKKELYERASDRNNINYYYLKSDE